MYSELFLSLIIYPPKKSKHVAIVQSYKNCFDHSFAIDFDIKNICDLKDHDLMMRVMTHKCKKSWTKLFDQRRFHSGIIQKVCT